MISDLPLRLPIIDIHTVGSGGGSIAVRTRAALCASARRAPAPIPGRPATARGDEVTVTDANLLLGRLDPERFLGGTMKLYPDRARGALEAFASRLKLDPDGLAEGIIRVADATMERAIRVISVERGYDTRDFALLSFGGAGGMHACSLAREAPHPDGHRPQERRGPLRAGHAPLRHGQGLFSVRPQGGRRGFPRRAQPALRAAPQGAGRDLDREGFARVKNEARPVPRRPLCRPVLRAHRSVFAGLRR